jgi:beta-glucanase (GH16 family)
MMKKFFFLIIVIFFQSSNLISQTLPECPIPGAWTFNQGLSDEFNAKKLDKQKWWDFNPSWWGRKPGHFDKKNVGLNKGVLEIKAQKLDSTKVSEELIARGMGEYSTGIIKSKTRVKYGYFEARCQVMKANVCNAFWLYDPLDDDKKYVAGDYSEEIDIFEIFGKAGLKQYERTYWATLHRMETPYVESIVKKGTKLPNHFKTKQVPYEFYDDFHVFGFHWTPEKLQWYLDGELVFERENDFFHRPLHIIFDAEIMKTWMGLPDAKDLPAVFKVDYFRIWGRKI